MSNQIAAYIAKEFTGYTASARVIAKVAQGYIDAAGVAGGRDEVTAIARDGRRSERTHSSGTRTEMS